jgi:hypothetical protein
MIRQNLRTWLLKPWMLVVLDGTAYGQDFTNNGGTIPAQYNQPSLRVQYRSATAVVVTQYNITLW